MTSPVPKPGSIIRYAYDWFADHEAGTDRSDRPHPTIVLAVAIVGYDRHTEVLCVAITHAPPYDPNDAIEIPDAVKGPAGLDADRQWVVISESNVFTWPGPDLRLRPGILPETYCYGTLPGSFLRTVALAYRARNRGSSTSPREVRRS